MSEYKNAVPNEGKLEKEGHTKSGNTSGEYDPDETSKSSKKHFNVLNEDGSLATDINTDGSKTHPGDGANEGSVGLGT